MVMLPPKKQLNENINNMEIWKTYREKTYNKSKIEVSDLGNVKRNGKYWYPKSYKNGYYNICGLNVHRMVAELFCDNPNNYNEVDHIDGNKHNNNKDNLRWVTHKENMNNPLTTTKISNTQKNNHITFSNKELRRRKQQAKGNNYVKGRIHINNGEICKMIKPEDLQTYLDKGWICGRIYRRNTCHS